MLKTKIKNWIFLTAFLAAGLSNQPCDAHHRDDRRIEMFQCGSFGRVKLTSYSNSAELKIPNKSKIAYGVIHSMMGGTDRTFTKSQTDDFRIPDKTTKENPIMLSMISGHVYGKKRDQITIHTLTETKTCIRITVD